MSGSRLPGVWRIDRSGVGLGGFGGPCQPTCPKGGAVHDLLRRVAPTPRIAHPATIVIALATPLDVIPSPIGVGVT